MLPNEKAVPSDGTAFSILEMTTIRSIFSLQLRNRLPAREPGIQLMSVLNRFLAQLPAQTDIPTGMTADEIHQPDSIILQLATDLRQLIHIVL